jgi:hypothetical protein
MYSLGKRIELVLANSLIHYLSSSLRAQHYLSSLNDPSFRSLVGLKKGSVLNEFFQIEISRQSTGITVSTSIGK